MNKLNTANSERGMTLVELLVVIVLLGMIAVIVGKNVIGKGEEAKAELNLVKMNKLKQDLGQYRIKFNSYPGQLQDLVKASPDIAKSGKLFIPLADEADLRDVWGTPYTYKSEDNGRSFSLTTRGADGLPGGDGVKQDVTIRP